MEYKVYKIHVYNGAARFILGNKSEHGMETNNCG